MENDYEYVIKLNEAEQKLKEMNTNNGITEQREKSKEQLSF